MLLLEPELPGPEYLRYALPRAFLLLLIRRQHLPHVLHVQPHDALQKRHEVQQGGIHPAGGPPFAVHDVRRYLHHVLLLNGRARPGGYVQHGSHVTVELGEIAKVLAFDVLISLSRQPTGEEPVLVQPLDDRVDVHGGLIAEYDDLVELRHVLDEVAGARALERPPAALPPPVALDEALVEVEHQRVGNVHRVGWVIGEELVADGVEVLVPQAVGPLAELEEMAEGVVQRLLRRCVLERVRDQFAVLHRLLELLRGVGVVGHPDARADEASHGGSHGRHGVDDGGHDAVLLRASLGGGFGG